MRILATLVLLLISTLSHAALNICPDGISYTSIASNQCPAYRTSLSILDIAQTTATITGVGDAQTAGSTHYYYVGVVQFPPGCTSANYTYANLSSGDTATRQTAERARQKCANFKTMIAGTGATAFGSTSVPDAGQFWLGMTGMTAATTYYVQEFHRGGLAGAGKTSVMSTQQVTTNSGGAAPGDTYVTDAGTSPRFIGTGGSDLNDGLTHSTRWLTLPKVTCALPAGTNIGILGTSTFVTSASQLDICYDSTANDWAIVGSYKLNGSSVPIWTVDGIRGATETDQKANILGNLTQGCIDARNCAFTQATFNANGQSSQYDAPISITGNYVEIKNIETNMQPGYAYLVYGTGNTTQGDTGLGSTHHVIVDGVDSFNTGGGVYAFVDGFKDGVVRNSTHATWGLCWQLKALGNSGANSNYLCDGSAVPSIMGLVRSYNGRLLVENNDAYGGIGEGWDCGEKSSHMIARGNRIYGNQSASFYPDGCALYVVENNIIVGGDDYGVQGAGNTGPGTSYSGVIAQDIEPFQGAGSNSGLIARNNLQVRPAFCFATTINPVAAAAGRTIDFKADGNTCVNPTDRILENWQQTPALAADDYSAFTWFNQVAWDQESATCNIVVPSVPVVSHHHFYSAPSASCTGSNQSTGDPQLVTAYTSWNSFKGPSSWPAFTDARPSPGSPLIDTGISKETAILTWADYGFAATEMADYRSGAITAANWVKERFYDALNVPVGATPPKGAVCAAAGC